MTELSSQLKQWFVPLGQQMISGFHPQWTQWLTDSVEHLCELWTSGSCVWMDLQLEFRFYSFGPTQLGDSFFYIQKPVHVLSTCIHIDFYRFGNFWGLIKTILALKIFVEGLSFTLMSHNECSNGFGLKVIHQECHTFNQKLKFWKRNCVL